MHRHVGWSDEILGFDCGGQQWVLETAFPTGSLDKPSGADLGYMSDLLAMIEARNIPAPAPIEQRWTASSASPMSPAYSREADTIHSWVGIIMYLPTEDAAQRAAISKRCVCLGDLPIHRIQASIRIWRSCAPPLQL